MKTCKLLLLVTALSMLAFAHPGAVGAAVTETVLHSFAGGATDGKTPYGDLLLDSSTFYGMTSEGGVSGATTYGTIFKYDTSTSTFTVLHSFAGPTADGSGPYGGLTLSSDGSTLYGMTPYGGTSGTSGNATSGNGTIFKIDTDGSNFQVLHSFTGSSTAPLGGSHPFGNLTLSTDGTLYGMTLNGGGEGAGTIFKFNPGTSTLTVLYSCQYIADSSHGSYPYGNLTLSADGSTLYGMTYRGGSSSNYGTVFSIGTDGTNFKVLHGFTEGGTDGGRPRGSLILSGSTLYGMTRYGGSENVGTAFSIGTDGTNYTVLKDFSSSSYKNGYSPGYGAFTLSGSTLYGTLEGGGENYAGVIFSIGTGGSNYTVVYPFKGSTTDGSGPHSSLTLADGGTLYGTTQSGGLSSYGTIFKVEGATAVELTSFTAKGSASKVALAWETGSETDNAGFNIHRSLRLRGDYEQINSGLIPAEGSPSEGAKYAYVDQEVEPGTSYFYKLEDVDNSGAGTLHGPVSARTATPPITLVSPADSIALPRTSPTFKWKAAGLKQYQIQFSQNASFTGQKLTPFKVISGSGYRPTAFEWKAVTAYMGKSNTVYWRVTGKNSGGKTVASESYSLRGK